MLWTVFCQLLVLWALLKMIGHNFGRRRSELAELVLQPGKLMGIENGIGLVAVAWAHYTGIGWAVLLAIWWGRAQGASP